MASHKTVKSISGLIQYEYAFSPIKNFYCRDKITMRLCYHYNEDCYISNTISLH